ncbi:MAG: undecaprenyl-diphosphate phosphatase, partial [Bacteroidetes bacterium]|nr:undecaprenyl-diphosphate phosphatase [Bacteroidota bacterium]
IIEGLTEYLPVSSTGHMIMAKKFMNLKEQEDLINVFIVAVQFGAILAVPVVFFKKFTTSIDFYIKLLVGFIPAGVIGFLLNDVFDQLLSSNFVVAFTMISVGVLLTQLDEWYHKNKNYVSRPITYKEAFIIGMFQCVALIPGVSRSAATIFGGLSQKLNWKQATEFSFFLAVPTLSAAAIYKTYKHWDIIQSKDGMIEFLLVGNAISFIIALVTVSLFIKFVQKVGFKYIGMYRVLIGLIFLISLLRAAS